MTTSTSNHSFIRRGFVSQASVDKMNDFAKAGTPFYLHHTMDVLLDKFDVTKMYFYSFLASLQSTFDVPVILQIADDNSFLCNEQLTLEEAQKLAYATAKQVLACGFNLDNTFVFANSEHYGHMYFNLVQVQQRITFAQTKRILNVNESDNIGKQGATAVRGVTCFASTFPVVLKGISEMESFDVCLRSDANDAFKAVIESVASRLLPPAPTPNFVQMVDFPPIAGEGSSVKMGIKAETPAVFVTDTPKEIKKKINKYALSGGGATREEHEANGADLEKDMSYQWLRYILDDNAALDDVTKKYGSGVMFTGECKAILIAQVTADVERYSAALESLSDDDVYTAMGVRPIV